MDIKRTSEKSIKRRSNYDKTFRLLYYAHLYTDKDKQLNIFENQLQKENSN